MRNKRRATGYEAYDSYWEECIAEALEEAGLPATGEQIKTIASWAEGAHDNYGMANGYDAISAPTPRKDTSEVDALKAEIEIYKASVMRRRNADHVWIESGEVRYE